MDHIKCEIMHGATKEEEKLIEQILEKHLDRKPSQEDRSQVCFYFKIGNVHSYLVKHSHTILGVISRHKKGFEYNHTAK